MDIEQLFNLAEMFLWLIISVTFFANGFRRSNRYKKLCFFLSAVFAAFGLSDGIEFHTGAWWQPWWLLLWKTVCIVIFIVCLTYYLRNERRSKMSDDPKEA